MYLHFDRNKLHLQILCGSLEKYEPSEEIKELAKKLADLNQKVTEFYSKTMEPELKAIEELIAQENTKQMEKSKSEEA